MTTNIIWDPSWIKRKMFPIIISKNDNDANFVIDVVFVWYGWRVKSTKETMCTENRVFTPFRTLTQAILPICKSLVYSRFMQRGFSSTSIMTAVLTPKIYVVIVLKDMHRHRHGILCV